MTPFTPEELYADFARDATPQAILDTDIENLKEVLRLIKPFQSLPQLMELETIIGKVQGAISQHVGDEIISMDHWYSSITHWRQSLT